MKAIVVTDEAAGTAGMVPRLAREAGAYVIGNGRAAMLTHGSVTCKFCLTGEREWMKPAVARGLLGAAEDPLRKAKEVLGRPGPLSSNLRA
jgi:hypothetical protein